MYKIVRYYLDDNKENKVIKTGITLKEAQEHCNNDETKGKDWFDGYTDEKH